ncbi:50S ribosomal protein L23 [Patescibacteria group bacterium]|nr:50S ribosomal protein L23 [Patescibacteria group bacterium]
MAVSDIKNNIGKVEGILLRPRITEKASDLAEKNVYVFEVSPRANKVLVKEAIKSIYKVDALRVNITKIPSKNVVSRGRKGVKTGGKKAVVYLKEGDKIEII